MDTKSRTARETLIYEALRFANWAAGEGICPVEGENAKSPEDFLMDFSNATNDEDWDTFAERISALPSSPVSDLVERLNLPWPPDGSGDEVTLPVWAIELMAEAASVITSLSTRNAELEREVKRLREALKAIRDKIPMGYLKRHDVSGATGPTDNLDLVAAVKDYSEDRWGLIDRITKKNSELERLRGAGENLKSIVEGIKGTMVHGTWRDEKGVRIKDTPEWVSFYLNISTSPQGGEHE